MTDQYQARETSYEPNRGAQRSYTPSLSERVAGAARAQPAGLLLLLAGTSLLLSGMRPPNREAGRRARTAVRKIAQGDFSPVTDSASDMASGVRDQVGDLGNRVGDLGNRASDIARSATDSLSGLAGDAQRAVRETSQQFVETAYSSAQSGVSFVLEDQPLLLAAIGLAAGATLGALIPATPQENRLMGETRDKVAELASETARQKLDELGDAAGEAAERLKNAVKERAGLATDDLGEVAKDVVEPFTNVASGASSSGRSGGGTSGGGTSGGGTSGQSSTSQSQSGGSVGKIS